MDCGLRTKTQNEANSQSQETGHAVHTQVTCNKGVFGDTLIVCLLPFGVRTVTAVPLAAIVCRDVAVFI